MKKDSGNLEPNMKSDLLFFQTDRCTGCQLCIMACSLMQNGSCGIASAHIRILCHPIFSYFTPVILESCLFTECKGECTEVCSLRILKLADDKQQPKLIENPKWQPVPALPRDRV